MSLLILLRHGNTFGPNDKVVMVGAGEDLPLSEVGEEQARSVGKALAGCGFIPNRIVCGPLKRTVRHAELVSLEVGRAGSYEIEGRLKELDFGPWSGLTNQEIAERFGSDELQLWNEKGSWPTSISFSPPEARVAEEVNNILEDSYRENLRTIVVTSNGRLRMFGRLVEPESSERYHGFKMRTGGASVLQLQDREWHIEGWNLEPTELSALLRKIQGGA
jgi:broad specificity phosphatase PhoE